jgi:predicted transcriptional regulator
MTSAYNFIAAWQLFPEKGTYEKGERPKSGYFQITTAENKNELIVNNSLVTLENISFGAKYEIVVDDSMQEFYDKDFATHVRGRVLSSILMEIVFEKNGEIVLEVQHEIQPNGYLKITQTGKKDASGYVNTEFYHKQMSVLPYSASVSGAVIKPTQEGVIRHKVLTAMEEQTNMQLDQIRKQVELLALQAQEIQSRKELSMIVYSAKLNFQPVIGQVYHLYENNDGSYMISMVSPNEWGRGSKSFKQHAAKVQLLADHTWKEIL